jgi:hypothetical protein
VARNQTRVLAWVAVALALVGLGVAASAWEPTASGPTPVSSRAITGPSHEPDALARTADALHCVLADNATLDPMVFTGASEKQAVDALATEVEVRARRWEGTLPWVPNAGASEESAWLLYDTDGAGHGIARAGLDQAPDSPLSGQWVAYLTDLCQGVLTQAQANQP